MYTLPARRGGAGGDVQAAPLLVWFPVFRRSHGLFVVPLQLPPTGPPAAFTTRADAAFSEGKLAPHLMEVDWICSEVTFSVRDSEKYLMFEVPMRGIEDTNS